MNEQQILNRMISGEFLVAYHDKIYTVRPPSVRLRQVADLYYDSLIKQYRFDGMPSKKVAIQKCINKDMLDKDYKDFLETSYKKLDQLKMDLFKAGPKISVANEIRKNLEATKKSIFKLSSYIQKIERNSLEGFAEYARHNYIFMHSIYLDDKPVADNNDIDTQVLNHVMYHYNLGALDLSEIRAFVRCSTWRQLWTAHEEEVFQNGPVDLTEEQKSCASYSSLYDFAYKSQNTPQDSVFEDDDMFDGWYLCEVESLKDNKQQDTGLGNPDPKYGEVYVVATDQEEADSIYRHNSQYGQKVLRERAHVLKTKGTVKDTDFKDVQEELTIQANQQFISKMKNG